MGLGSIASVITIIVFICKGEVTIFSCLNGSGDGWTGNVWTAISAGLRPIPYQCPHSYTTLVTSHSAQVEAQLYISLKFIATQ